MQGTMQPPPYASCGLGRPPVATPVSTMIATVIPQHTVGFTPRQRRTLTILSGLQIAIGISCVIIYIVLISIHRMYNVYLDYPSEYLDYMGAGIWCGGLYITAGSLALTAARKNRLRLIMLSIVFNILSSLALWVVVGFAASAMSKTIGNLIAPCSSYNYEKCVFYDASGYNAADGILIILSVIEFVVSVWCIVLCYKGSCKACCPACFYDNNYGYQAQLVYMPEHSPGQHVMMAQQSGIADAQAMSALPNQPFTVCMELPVHFVYQPAALAATAAAPPCYQPGAVGVGRPEYTAAHMVNASADGATFHQRGEVTKDEMANGY